MQLRSIGQIANEFCRKKFPAGFFVGGILIERKFDERIFRRLKLSPEIFCNELSFYRWRFCWIDFSQKSSQKCRWYVLSEQNSINFLKYFAIFFFCKNIFYIFSLNQVVSHVSIWKLTFEIFLTYYSFEVLIKKSLCEIFFGKKSVRYGVRSARSPFGKNSVW